MPRHESYTVLAVVFIHKLKISKMSKSIDISIKSKVLRLTVSHNYKPYEGGYYHIPFLVFSWGSNGFGIHLVGVYGGVSLNNR